MVHILADFTMVDTHTANFCPAWEPWWIRQPLTQAGFSWEAWTPTKMASLPISGRMTQCRYNIVQISWTRHDTMESFFPDGVSYCNVDAKREGRPSEKLKQKENAHWQRLCGDCLQRVRASLQYWHCQVSVHICGEQLWRYWWWMKHSLPGGVGRASRLWKQQDQRALQAGDGQHHRSPPSDIKVMGWWIICWISAPNEKVVDQAINTGKRNGAGRGWCRTKMLHGSLARSFIVVCQMMIFYCICCISRLLFIAALLPS